MKTNRIIKTSLGFFALGLLGMIAGSAGFSVNQESQPVLQAQRRAIPKRDIDPSEYTHVSSSELTSTLRDYTGTSLSRYYNVQFESNAIKALRSAWNDVFSVVDDLNFSGDFSNPFIHPQEGKTLTGYVYRGNFSTSHFSNSYIVVPREISYGDTFVCKNHKIASNCMYDPEVHYADLDTIYIWDEIPVVEKDAFINVPENITIKCKYSAKPEEWDDNWTDAKPEQILWGQTMPANSETSRSIGIEKFGDAADFILGYQGNNLPGEEHIDRYPLIFRYEKIKADGQHVFETVEIPKKHLTNSYDAVGSSIYGYTNSFTFTVEFEAGEQIVDDSGEFYNIFRATRQYNDNRYPWPDEDLQTIYDNYPGLEAKFPKLDGDSYTHQLYEKEYDKYITIACQFDTEEQSLELVNHYKFLIESEEDELGQKLYSIDDKYLQSKYGYVYRRYFDAENGQRFAMYIQLYSYNNHFIVYLFVDKMVIPEGKTDWELSRTLPINAMTNAVRPYSWIPDLSQGKYYSTIIPAYGKMTNISDIFTISYNKSSTFDGYTSVGMTATKNKVTTYTGIPYFGDDSGKTIPLLLEYDEYGDPVYVNGKDSYYPEDVEIVGSFEAPQVYIENNSARSKVQTNIQSIMSGKIAFRYVLSNLNNASLVVRYLSGGVEKKKNVKIVSPSPVIELDSDKSNLNFIINSKDIEGVAPNQILALGVSGVTVNIHLYNTESNTIVQNTALLKIFGNIEVFPYNPNGLSYFNINTYIILFASILAGAYIVLTVAYFFYCKNKYKNDEFRRVKPKQFFKTAAAVFLGLELLALAVNFIVLRFAVFYSSVAVYNPIDPFVIVFGIAGAISLGLFIRMFIIIAKQNKHIKETKRLHLDKDVADDGTN